MPIGASTFSEAMKMGTETYHELKKVINKKYGLDGMCLSSSAAVLSHAHRIATNVGDEGGCAPNVSTPEEALDLLVTAIKQAEYEGLRIKIGIDAAASEFYSDGK